MAKLLGNECLTSQALWARRPSGPGATAGAVGGAALGQPRPVEGGRSAPGSRGPIAKSSLETLQPGFAQDWLDVGTC